MIDASNYKITVGQGWFDGEQCYEALVTELPDVAEYADAYALAIDTIEVTAEMLAVQGKAMPAGVNPAEDYVGYEQGGK